MLCSNFLCAEIECRGRDYMMNYIWLAMLVFSLFAAAAKGNMGALSSALISGGTDAVSLALKLVGIICFWNGLMAVAEKSGLTRLLCRLLSPVLKLLFPTLKDEKAKNIPEDQKATVQKQIDELKDLLKNEKYEELKQRIDSIEAAAAQFAQQANKDSSNQSNDSKDENNQQNKQ